MPARQRERAEAFASALVAMRFNGTAAAIAIGIPPKGAHVIANRLLNNQLVQDAIQRRMDAIKAKHDVTIDKVVGELKLIGFSNIADYTRLEPDGSRVIDFTDCNREQLAAVASIETEETIVSGRRRLRQDEEDESEESGHLVKRHIKLRMHNKQTALTDLLKFLLNKLGDSPAGNDNGNGTTLIDNSVHITQVGVAQVEAADRYQKMLERPQPKEG